MKQCRYVINTTFGNICSYAKYVLLKILILKVRIEPEPLPILLRSILEEHVFGKNLVEVIYKTFR